MSDINPLDVLAIKNVISRYCQALDTKDFDMLEEVFVSDVDADYPFNSSMKSVKEVASAIKKRYAYKSVQLAAHLSITNDLAASDQFAHITT